MLRDGPEDGREPVAPGPAAPSPRTQNDLAVARAGDPAASAWVAANAGAGKTFVLTRRVVRLLLAGVPPSRILCLTYTRAAAAEMLDRVHGLLAGWARLSEPDLCAELEAVTGSRAARGECERARILFAKALDTPGGLKIQTIHAFCEALLHRFPLEANVSGRFRMLDEAERAAMMDELAADLVADGAGGAVRAILDLARESGLSALTAALDGARGKLDAARDAYGDGLRAALARRLGLAPDDTADTILADAWPVPGFGNGRWAELTGAARHHGGKTNGDFADTIDRLHELAGAERLAALVHLTHNSKGEPRAGYCKKGNPTLSGGFTNKVLADLDWLHDAMLGAYEHVGAVNDRLRAHRLVEASGHALELAHALHRRWADTKHRRGLMDFDDLIARTAALLDREGGHGWVHYKLDRGIDHVLVDEAQDTAPLQWRVIDRLTAEFHAGESDRARTVFAVGDPKQSIYSFQGAAPQGFVDTGDRLQQLYATRSGAFHRQTLRLSFRSTRDVLSAVDAVFAHAERAPLGAMERESHVATRRTRGRVELWDFEKAREGAASEGDWTEALDSVAPDDPRARLARRIAGTIRDWLDGVDPLDGGRAPKPGDVMVLVRKRDAFTTQLTRALKDRGVPVAGEDRLRLTAHVAVEDLMALGRMVLDPHDDLAVAALFKSPLVGLTEDDLFRLAHGRKADRSLYRTLRRRADEEPRWRKAADLLAEWRDRADREPPFEFYARILGPDGGRRRFLARLGAEAGDVLDEFLSRALEERPDVPPGLESFLAALRAENPVIKREMDGRAGEVRVMTVHGAKGLEAPVVFVVDPGSEAVHASHLPSLLPLEEPGDDAAPLAWLAPGLKRPDAAESARGRAAEAAKEEYWRLLYVAMTRARDRLVLCGSATSKTKDATWLGVARQALLGTGRCEAVEGCETETLRYVAAERAAPQTPRDAGGPDAGTAGTGTVGTGTAATAPGTGAGDGESAADAGAVERPSPATRPSWLDRAAPEREPPRPLAPAGATALIEGTAAGRVGPLLGGVGGGTIAGIAGGRRDGVAGDSVALRRGTLVHRLLQVLPHWPESERAAAARRYAERACADMPGEACDGAIEAALAVLEDPAFAELWQGEARAEVAVMGTLEIDGRATPVSGTIDRIVLSPGRALLVDYKTGRRVPRVSGGVPPLHVGQMALYRALVAPLLDGRRVECALVYTEGPRRIDLEPWRLSAALARLQRGESLEGAAAAGDEGMDAPGEVGAFG